jgi:PAS domain S-box-containing protein
MVIFSDITEQNRAERELRASHAEMEQLFSSISSILISIDGEDQIIRWNSVAEETFGLQEAEVVGKPLDEAPISWDWDQVLRGSFVCREKGKPIRMDDVRFMQRNGKHGFLSITFNPILSENSASVGILILASEVTARKLLESQLAQAQKLESIGQLAAGIAHEINTPTQYVGDNLRSLEGGFEDLLRLIDTYRKLVEDLGRGIRLDGHVREIQDVTDEIDLDYLMEELPKSIGESLEGVGRVAKIVLSMKEFSHPGTGEMSLTDINKAVESTITVARNEWKYVSEMVTDLDPSLPLVSCIPGELNQVILNIIINASHAIKEQLGENSVEKGVITITTRRNGESCEIRISDTGPGIPEEIRGRIFDPFFTTKEVGKGTGQGLALSHTAIVEKHGGSISFETEIGKGTCFIIGLPLEV